MSTEQRQSKWRVDVRLSWWLLRQVRGRAIWLVSCLIIAVVGLIAVQGFSRAVDSAIGREARNLLLADVSIDSRQPIAEERLAELTHLLPPGSQWQLLIRGNSMARFGQQSQLVQVHLAEELFPWYSTLQLQGADGPLSWQQDWPADAVAVRPELLQTLGIDLGDQIHLGPPSVGGAGNHH